MMLRPFFMWAAILCAACLGACERVAGKGGGTETESKVVAGRLVDAEGNPSVAARVSLRPDDYLADPVSPVASVRVQETITDAQGRYILRELPAGGYRIEFAGVESGGSIRDFSLGRDSQGLVLPVDTLRPRGSIAGSFAPDTEVQLSRFVQVYGMERLVKADRPGAFVLANMPGGRYDIRFSSLQPFRREAIRRDVVVHPGQQTTLDPVTLAKEAKLAFSIDSTGLRIEGVDSANPVIMDNERWDNGIENEYLWAKASLGSVNLRGNIATNDFRAGRNTVAEQVKRGDGEVADAQRAGMTGIPGMTPGAAVRLAMPPSGRLEDIPPQHSEGSDLIVAEARLATPEKPLLVIVGGPLTTVAQAWLTDPSIASRMVVAGVFSYTLQPQTDSLANYLVAKKCRFLDWGRNYTWSGALDAPRLADIPLSRMGERVRNFLAASPGLQSFGDLAPIAYLFRRALWRTAGMVKVSSTLEVQPASDITFDFLDIPFSANSWPLYSEEFFSTLSNPGVYHPAALPGRLPAEAMLGMANMGRVAIDSAAGTVGAAFGTGSWADYKVVVAQAGDYRLTLRYRSGGGARVSVGAAGQSSPVETALPPSPVWAEATLDALPLDAGTYLLRVGGVSGSCDLEWMDFRP